jgi:hypothetical protein
MGCGALQVDWEVCILIDKGQGTVSVFVKLTGYVPDIFSIQRYRVSWYSNYPKASQQPLLSASDVVPCGIHQKGQCLAKHICTNSCAYNCHLEHL